MSTPRRPAIPLWPGLAAAALVGLVYLLFAGRGSFHLRQSNFPHHVLVADAWLHGQLSVREEVLADRVAEYLRQRRDAAERGAGRLFSEEEWTLRRQRMVAAPLHDWAIVDGRYYGYWPPMPSALLLPYVALVGPGASDTLVSCLVGAAGVFLTFLMVREAAQRGFAPGSAQTTTALALLLGLGTVHFYLAASGQVWFLSQILESFFLTLAIWLALRGGRRATGALAAGAALGAAFLTRSNAIATAPFFLLAFRAQHEGAERPWRGALLPGVWFSLPLIAAGAIALAFNQARFGDPFDNGWVSQTKTMANPRFLPDYLAHGIFSPWYLGRNIFYYFLNPLLRHHPVSGALTFDPEGNSMFLVTPALLYALRASPRQSWFTLALWLGLLPGLLLLLLFIGPGWYQFGNRYFLDVMPLAILLVAVGLRGRLTRVSLALIAASIAVNFWGAYRFFAEQS